MAGPCTPDKVSQKCLEHQVRPYVQNWHKQKAFLNLEIPAVLMPASFSIDVEVAGASDEAPAGPKAKLYERDVGASRPRGPPIACV